MSNLNVDKSYYLTEMKLMNPMNYYFKSEIYTIKIDEFQMSKVM